MGPNTIRSGGRKFYRVKEDKMSELYAIENGFKVRHVLVGATVKRNLRKATPDERRRMLKRNKWVAMVTGEKNPKPVASQIVDVQYSDGQYVLFVSPRPNVEFRVRRA